MAASRRTPPSARGSYGRRRGRVWALAVASSPSARPATTRLAASRMRSHSQAPGKVSSKSLMSNSRSRSGEANRPKFDRCASPHAWTVMPLSGSRGQVRRHRQRRPAVERERRDRHPPVADRHQLRDPGRCLLLEEGDRIRPVGCRLPVAMAGSRRLAIRASRPMLGLVSSRVGIVSIDPSNSRWRWSASGRQP